jgi:predicted transcriptional regulator
LLEAKQKRRDQLCIIANILEISLKGTLKTQIMYRANLSFKQLNEYLSFLIAKGLIVQIMLDGKASYQVTNEGMGFLRRYRELTKTLHSKTARLNRTVTPVNTFQASQAAH